MKFKVFKWYVRLYDLAVFLFLVGYFFHKPFRDLIDSSPYLVKASIWFAVVLFFYFSISAWYRVVRVSMVNVLSREEEEAVEDSPVGCDYVAGLDKGEKSNLKDNDSSSL